MALDDDELIKEIKKQLDALYNTSTREMAIKLKRFLSGYEEANQLKLKQLAAGEISKEDYNKWLQSRANDRKWLENMVDKLTEDAVKTDAKAVSIVKGFTHTAYANGYNYAAYQLEYGYQLKPTFTIYNAQTVEKLVKDKPDLLPLPQQDIPEDRRWHKQKMTDAITQGILQGEPIKDVAERLQAVTGMDNRAAIRNARTALTGAQNAGRVKTYQDAEEQGIKVEQQWVATFDERTRISHRLMDGERVEVGGVFSNGCRYPGDPRGAPEEVYNCRCTLVGVLSEFGFARKMPTDDLNAYERWKESRKK